MEAPDAAMWVEGIDNSGRPIWRHRHNGATRFTNPWGADQTVAPHLNGGKKSVHFNLGPDPAQEAWEECFDRITGRNYWYNSTTRETTWIDPQVATKKPPPPPPSNPPPGSNPLQQPLSQLPPNQPGWSFSQAPSSFDAPSALGDPPSQPPSMPSRHGPSSQQAPATLGNPPSQMPAWPSREGRKKHKNERPLTPPPSNPPGWNTCQPFSSTFLPPPPQNPPGWTSDPPRSQWVPHPPPAFTAMSPQPPPPPPPPEFTPWQPQPSAPSLQPPPPPPPPPLPAPLKSGDSKKGAGETVATSWKPNLPKREQDDWSKRVNAIGKKEWFNEKTGRSQILRPDCLRKYR